MVATGWHSEACALRDVWDAHDEVFLNHYLVSGVEDPRINCSSIIERGLLAEMIMGSSQRSLIHDEFLFGAILCWVRSRLDEGMGAGALLDGLSRDVPSAPPGLRAIRQAVMAGPLLPWLEGYLAAPQVAGRLDLFQSAWADMLRAASADRTVEVLEFACGSANDYRFWDRFGYGRIIRYHGIDISTKNIANSRRRFPTVDFRCGDVLDSGWETASVDVVMANDLMEHLPPESAGHAISEMLRIARSEVWLGCFRLVAGNRIFGRPVGSYHVNDIGRDWLRLACPGCHLEVVDIPRLVARALPGVDYHNNRAGIVIITKPEPMDR